MMICRVSVYVCEKINIGILMSLHCHECVCGQKEERNFIHIISILYYVVSVQKCVSIYILHKPCYLSTSHLSVILLFLSIKNAMITLCDNTMQFYYYTKSLCVYKQAFQVFSEKIYQLRIPGGGGRRRRCSRNKLFLHSQVLYDNGAWSFTLATIFSFLCSEYNGIITMFILQGLLQTYSSGERSHQTNTEEMKVCKQKRGRSTYCTGH